MVNIELYRIFIAIYRAGTISKAAVLSKITQPAASQQLALLERTLNVKLFERTPRKMVATDTGHELYTKVSDSFDWLDFVSQDFVLERSEKKVLFHLGVPMEFFNAKLIGKLQNLPFRLQIHFGSSQELSEKLKETKLHAMVSTQYISKVENKPIFRENFVLVGHKSIAKSKVDFNNWHTAREWFMKQEWIAYDHELSIIRRYFKTLYNLRPNIQPTLIVPNLQSIIVLLKEFKGVTVLPYYLVKEALDNKELQLFHLPKKAIENQLYLSYENISSSRILVQTLLERLN